MPTALGPRTAGDAASKLHRTPVSNGSLGTKTAEKRKQTADGISGGRPSRGVGNSQARDLAEQSLKDEEHLAPPAAKKRKSQEAPPDVCREILRNPGASTEMLVMAATHRRVKNTMDMVHQVGKDVRELHSSQAQSFEDLLGNITDHIDSVREQVAEKADIEETSELIIDRLQRIEARIQRVEDVQRVNFVDLFETLHELKEEIRDRSHGPAVQVYYGVPHPYAIMPPR